MGKYTEALRKIEEERVKQIQEQPTIKAASFNLRSYAIGIIAAATLFMILIYAYGVYSGTRLAKKFNTVEAPTISPIPQMSNIDQNTAVLENIEKTLQLSSTEPMESKPVVNTQPKLELKEEKNFYTVQLVAYQQEAVAKLEARKLSQMGFRPIIILRGTNLFKVCVGMFETNEQANQELERIRQTSTGATYQGLFVRWVKAKK